MKTRRNPLNPQVRIATLQHSTNKMIRENRKELLDAAAALQGDSIKDWADTINFLRDSDAGVDYDLPTLYCNITGQPIGTLSLEIIDLYRKSRKSPNRKDLFDTLTLASQAAPHWMNRTPLTLKRNMELDPFGFFMYMLDRSYSTAFQAQKTRDPNSGVWNWKSSSDHCAWTRLKITAYGIIKELDAPLIVRANRALAWVDAKIGLTRIQLPFSSPLDFSDDESLRILIQFLSGYLQEYQNDVVQFNNKYHPEPNRAINSFIMQGHETESEKTQREYMKDEMAKFMYQGLTEDSGLGELMLEMKLGGKFKLSESSTLPPGPKPVHTTDSIIEAAKAKLESAPKLGMSIADLLKMQKGE